jgi:hypothetical protein
VPHCPARRFATVALLTLPILLLGPFLAAGAARAQEAAQEAQEPQALPDLTGIVKDEGWARILGKALFWDTVARANGSDCASCHFVTGANRRIPDQSEAPLQALRAAIDGPAAQWAGPLAADDSGGIVDVCSRRVEMQPAEMPDFGPVRTSGRVADEDPSCKEDLRVQLARSLLEHKPLEERSINPGDGTFGPAGPHGNLVSPTGRGLERTYQWMIEQAFEEPLWKAPEAAAPEGESSPAPTSGARTKVEKNFPLFWGIAVMIYESTLDPHWARDHEIARSLPIPAAAPGHAEWE